MSDTHNTNTYDTYDTYDIFVCPHCSGEIQVYHNERNCHIFRHGVFLSNGQQIPPHSSKMDCDRWAAEGAILGCGKPFRLVPDDAVQNGKVKIVECEYI